jgi:hypothetical protein
MKPQPLSDNPTEPTLGHAESKPYIKPQITIRSTMSEGLKAIYPDAFNALLVEKLREENRKLRETLSEVGQLVRSNFSLLDHALDKLNFDIESIPRIELRELKAKLPTPQPPTA